VRATAREQGPVATRRFYVIGLLLLASSVVACFNGNVLEALSSVAVFVTYVAVASGYLIVSSRKIVCELSDFSTELEGNRVRLRLHVSILTQAASVLVGKLYVAIPPQLSPTYRRVVLSMRINVATGQVVLIYLARRTGLHTIGPLRVTISDPLQLVERTIYYEEFVTLKVPPEVSTAPVAKWYGIVRSSSGARTLTPGTGIEYHSTREYQPGDEPRYIDWKATARLGKLHVKVFEVETSLRVALVLDASSYMFIGSPRSLFEQCADIAVALANYLIKRRDRLILIVLTEEGVKLSKEARNYRDFIEVLNVITSIEWPRHEPAIRVETPSRPEGLSELREVINRSSAAIILSPVLSKQRVFELAELARRSQERGVKFIVIAPLITFFGSRDRLFDVLYRILRFDILGVEIKNVEAMRNLGVQVIAMSPQKAVEKVVAELEKVRASRAC